MQDMKKEVPVYADPFYRPPPKPTETPTQVIPTKIPYFDTLMYWNRTSTWIFGENSACQEDVISEIHQRPDKSYFQEPPELQGLVSTGKLVQKLLPKQADIDKILKM